jgi:hypothetical protein
MHDYISNIWCEQYIEYIVNILHLKNKLLNLRNWDMVIFLIIINYYLACIFYTLKKKIQHV